MSGTIPRPASSHAMIATQSPYEVAEVAAHLVSKSKFPLKQVDLKVGYTVGYGSKDHSILPFYLRRGRALRRRPPGAARQ